MHRWQFQEEETEELGRFQAQVEVDNYFHVERWFLTTKPWKTSLAFGLVMLQLSESKFRDTPWWDTWAATWLLVHKDEATHILGAGLVPTLVIDLSRELREYETHKRQQDLLKSGRRKDAPRWHILGNRK